MVPEKDGVIAMNPCDIAAKTARFNKTKGAARALSGVTALLSALIRFYKAWISPLLGPGNCRYHPTCSAYALQALEIHGPVRGLRLAARRILSCHAYSRRPFHDPVPEAITPVSAATETTEKK